jgi:hypothetical protein
MRLPWRDSPKWDSLKGVVVLKAEVMTVFEPSAEESRLVLILDSSFREVLMILKDF